MMKKTALLIAICLLASCQQKGQTNTQTSSAQTGTTTPTTQAPTKPNGNDIKATLLQVAQANPSVAERKFCSLVTSTDKARKVEESTYLSEGSLLVEAVETGYFTVSGLGTGRVTLTPTEKYMGLWKEAQPKVDKYGLYSTWCFGTGKLTELQNFKQAAPDKYLASGVMTLDPFPWATREVLKIFGPARNDGVYTPVSLVFYKSPGSDAWEVEKR